MTHMRTLKKYVQVNIYEGNFGDYEVMQFTIKKNDKKYIIHSIAKRNFLFKL